MAVMAGHLQRHPRSIREQRPEVPPELEAIVLTAMRRYPENRYQSAAELLDDLNALNLDGPAAGARAAEKQAPSANSARAAPPTQARAGPPAQGGVRPAVPTYGALRGGRTGPTGGRLPPGGPPAQGGSPRTFRQGPPSGGAASRDLSPEKPIGRLPAPASRRDFWVVVALVAGGFIGLVAVIVVISKLAH